MIGRLSLLVIGLAGGIALAGASLPQLLPTALTSGSAAQNEVVVDHVLGAGSAEERQGLVKLSAADIEAAGIELAAVRSGTISRRIIVPGTIRAPADRIVHVAVRLSGIVAELRKNVGDPVAAGEILAILESREVANAKSEYLAARVTNELQQEMLNRDTALWEPKVIADQQLLRSRNAAANAKIANDIARQKLFALGLTEKGIVRVMPLGHEGPAPEVILTIGPDSLAQLLGATRTIPSARASILAGISFGSTVRCPTLITHSWGPGRSHVLEQASVHENIRTANTLHKIEVASVVQKAR
jgi:multidrug efflux pump subunit AcrA (membrane-fusion protein)